MELADNFATLGIQRGEERGHPMPRVVLGPALDLPRPHRQHGLRAIERLDLGFFVHAQHQRLVRRIEVEPDEVADFVDEQRIFGQLEGLAPMRLQPERAPDSAHRRLTESAARRHRTRTPGRGVPRRAFQGQGDHPLDLDLSDKRNGELGEAGLTVARLMVRDSCCGFADITWPGDRLDDPRVKLAATFLQQSAVRDLV